MLLDSLLWAVGLGFLAWLWWWTLKRSEDPAKFAPKSLLTAVLVLGEVYLLHRTVRYLHEGGSVGMLGNFVPALMIAISAVVVGVAVSIIWASEIGAVLFRPLTSLFDGGTDRPEQSPLYYKALARRNLRRPLEAIVLIREQLARFPDHFQGVMLLANIQAEDLNDLPGAEMTLNHFCNSPRAFEWQIAAAYSKLADWYLRKASDVVSAREALRKIMERFPDTESARRAEQRIAQLAGTEKDLLAQQTPSSDV
jgi:hypothetical protein